MPDFTKVKLGKLPVRYDDRTLLFSNYVTNLTPPPSLCNLTSKISHLGMMKNDEIGDCTCAAVGHAIQQWTAEAGSQAIIPDNVVVEIYSAITGYNPKDIQPDGSNPTDQGANELDVLNYWKKHPVAGHTLAGYVSVHPQKIEEVKNAIFLFGNSYIGVALPLSAQGQDIWDVVPDDGTGNTTPGSWGGHAVTACAYDQNYIYVITWGEILKVTYPFFAKYCEEAYALLSPDWIAKATAKCPDGVDYAALQTDLKEVGA